VTLARARAEIELWRVDYNRVRPHSSLDYRTPEAFGESARAHAREALDVLPSALVVATSDVSAMPVDCSVGEMG
jgi:Integrase core domain